MSRGPNPSPLRARLYRGAALLLLNGLLLLLLLNAGAWIAYAVRDRVRLPVPAVVHAHGEDALVAAYPDRDAASVMRLLDETWSRELAYEPFTQVRERPFAGEFVNVHAAGFRVGRDQGPWPPDPASYNVFLFGGSTTFGYGVADDETIGSYLQARLGTRDGRPVRVYNFGTAFHRSTQSVASFEQRLLDGHLPDLAVFVDGLNDFAYPYGPAQTRLIAQRFAQDWCAGLGAAFRCLPLGRALTAASGGAPPPAPPADVPDDERLLASVIDRYVASHRIGRAVAAAHGVEALFVWQPVPMYGYDLRHHPFSNGLFGHHQRAGPGYALFARRLASGTLEGELGDDFLWLGDLQRGLAEPLYVDRVHYSARMNRLVAAAIADALDG